MIGFSDATRTCYTLVALTYSVVLTDASAHSSTFAEISASGSIRLADSGGAAVLPDAASAFSEVGANRTGGYPADVLNANAVCGGPRFISTCRFPGESDTPSCFLTANGKRECVFGLCVCGNAAGCVEPTCSSAACQLPMAVQCADGQSCVAKTGIGWQCWHPCNPAHSPEEFGRTNGALVNHIRSRTDACRSTFFNRPAQQPDIVGVAGRRRALVRKDAIESDRAADIPRSARMATAKTQQVSQSDQLAKLDDDAKDPPLDAGLELTRQSTPIVGEQVNVGAKAAEDEQKPKTYTTRQVALLTMGVVALFLLMLVSMTKKQ